MKNTKIIYIVVILLVLFAGIIYYLNFYKNNKSASVINAISQNQIRFDDQSSTVKCIFNTSDSSLRVVHYPDIGDFYASKDCRILYVSSADKKDESSCYDDCAKNWIPYISTELSPQSSKDPMTNILNIVTRKDNTKQYALNGQPLYVYFKDLKLGEISGTEVGNGWTALKIEIKKP